MIAWLKRRWLIWRIFDSSMASLWLSYCELKMENERLREEVRDLRHTLTVIAEGCEESLTEWAEGHGPRAFPFVKETARRARAAANHEATGDDGHGIWRHPL